ncbi:MAG: OmcA/MtrC family decaheme c-type cytochrome, partial [Chloroflexota bacterium]|nr:OmcA/MtrC family decaheme c-type cytochrome [Chloroflexota bacterium]
MDVTVYFSVEDAAGLPVVGLTDFEFTIAKLIVPTGAGNYPRWQSYINRSRIQGAGARVLRAAGERATATTLFRVTEIAPGDYAYTFGTDLDAVGDFVYYGSGTEPVSATALGVGASGVLNSAAATAVLATLDVEYNPAAVHRVGIASRNPGTRYNAVKDFVPATLPALLAQPRNQVVTTESCGGCHGKSDDRRDLHFPNLHGNTRFDTDLCVTCHNPSTFDSLASTDTAWAPLTLNRMVHSLHASVPGYSASGRDYSHVTYPQSPRNCLTCHDNQRVDQPAERTVADAEAFKNRPTRASCNTCHSVDFAAHFGNQTTDTTCAGCHTGAGAPAPIDVRHASNESTPNNPLQPAGFAHFETQIDSVTIDANRRPIVKFRLLANGQPLTFASLPAGYNLGNLRFYATWSAPQPLPASAKDGPAFATPADFNNLGTTAGRVWWNGFTSLNVRSYDQPMSLGTVLALLATFTGPDANGFYTTAAGISATPFAYPANAQMMAIGLEGRPTINSIAVFTKSNIAGVGIGQNTPRRVVVDTESCNGCHESLVFHGGGRADNADWCVACHNPENSSSNIFFGEINGVVHRQLPMNLKDLVHGLHAGKPLAGEAIRRVPFAFIRGNQAGGSGQGVYDFSHIGFPGRLNDCQACHNPGTHSLPITPDALWSVVDGYAGG